MSQPALWIALAACFMGCYFAACNIALKTFSKSRLTELLEERGRAHRLEAFLQRVPRFMLMTAMVRTTMSLIVLLATLYFIENSTPDVSRLNHYVLALAVAGALVSIFCVAVPLSWARYHPEELLAWSMAPLRATYLLTQPLISSLTLLDPIVRRLSGGQHKQDEPDRVSEEVLSVVDDHEISGNVDESQRQMIEAVFDFNTITAGQIMTPRTDMVGIEATASLDEIKRVLLEQGHSRIPVYEETIDQIVGILYAKDLIQYLGQPGQLEAYHAARTMRQALMVPESKSVRDLLAEFKARKVHIAIVLDEYGGTAGLVTIEDILEELVGDIQDEYERTEEPPAVTQIDPTTAEVDARIHIDDLNDELGLELPEDGDYDTLGGFVFSTLGHVPEVGERFDYQDIAFTITDAERTKVKRVRLVLPNRNSDAQTAEVQS